MFIPTLRRMSNSDILNQAEDCLRLALSQGADAGDVMVFDTLETTAKSRMGKPEGIDRAESCGLGLRVLVQAEDGLRAASVSTSDMGTDAIAELVERAISMARISPPDAFTCLAPEALLAKEFPDLDLAMQGEVEAEALKDMAARAEQAALDVQGITNSDGAEANFDHTNIALVTSNGFAQRYASTSLMISASVVAGEGTNMETDYDYHVVRHAEDIDAPEVIGRSAAERTLKKLNPKKQKTCTVPVIFDPRVARELVGQFTSAVNGASVVRGTSFLEGRMGKQVFAKGVQLFDDPFIVRGLGSEPFDAEGVQGQKRALIEDGVLQTWLLDMRSAKKLGLTTTGNAGRGLGSPPSPSTTNVYLAAGTASPQELLADIKQGFYVTEAFGMGINGVTGDYSQGASGFWIENGELTHAVSEMTIAGNMKEMFLNLTPANDLRLRYGTNSPTLLVPKMMVAGS